MYTYFVLRWAGLADGEPLRYLFLSELAAAGSLEISVHNTFTRVSTETQSVLLIGVACR